MDDGYTAADLSPLEAIHSVKSLDHEPKRQKKEKSKDPKKRKKDSVTISAKSGDENDENISDNIKVNESKGEQYQDMKGRTVDIVIE
jgi:hypothetical protein